MLGCRLAPLIPWLALLSAGTSVASDWGPLAPERIDFGIEISHEAAIGTRDDRFQKVDFRLQPELTIDFTDGLSLTAIGRLRVDVFDRIEPGRPSQPEISQLSRRRALGSEGDFDLRELYVEGELGPVLVTAGKQQVVWGTADGLKVLDLVNPQDFREFILPAFEDSRIPLWTLDVEVPLGDVQAQLIWIPDPSFHDIPEPGALYAFSSPHVVPRAPPGAIVTVERADRPRNRFFSNSEFGLRLLTFFEGWDLTVNYLYHYDDFPILFRSILAGPGGAPRIAVRPGYRRTHSAGGTFSNAFGDFTVRGELGYSTDRYFSTTDPSDRDGVFRTGLFSYVVGIDWYGLENTLVGVQLFQRWRPEVASGSIARELDTFVTWVARRHFLNEQLVVECAAIYDPREGDALLRPKVRYDLSDHWRIWAGFDAFLGSRDGLFGQFTERDRVVLGVKWSI